MKDARLELGRYISNPFDNKGRIPTQLNFRDLFRDKHATETGGSPWVPSRYTFEDLTKAIQNRKVIHNPKLNYVPNSPFWDDENQLDPKQYEMFEGLGRFNRSDYSFEEGRALTKVRPENQPDFSSVWVEAYRLSPTIKPEDRAKNPMPRTKNPDPNGYIMQMAQKQVEDEVQGSKTVSEILPQEKFTLAEEDKGAEEITQEEQR